MIVALVLSIVSVSVGFAAFSSVLNISSSANVSPNSSDFNIKFYDSFGNAVTNDVMSGGYIIENGDVVYLKIIMSYDFVDSNNLTSALADGPFEIIYSSVVFDFTTAIE